MKIAYVKMENENGYPLIRKGISTIEQIVKKLQQQGIHAESCTRIHIENVKMI